VRVIAATNRRLEREVNAGRFREDLYFRLSVVTVRMPSLRRRLEDIPILIQVILGSLNAEESSHLFTPAVIEDMMRYDWPGNVRELRNYVGAPWCSSMPPSFGARFRDHAALRGLHNRAASVHANGPGERGSAVQVAKEESWRLRAQP
jgi:DNA-binding NtrC family response regulator